MSSESSSRPSTGAGIKSIPLDPGLCRNITIHGYCKWQDKGCKFHHGEPKTNDHNAARLRPETPTFTPGSSMASTLNAASFTPGASNALSANAGLGAPVFVPRGATSSPARQYVQDSQPTSFASPVRGSNNSVLSAQAKPSPQTLPFVPLDATVMRTSNLNSISSYPSPQLNPYDQGNNDLFYQSRQAYQPLQYHLYSSLPPNKKSLARNERTSHDFFMNDSLRESLQRKQAAALQTLQNSNLPTLLHSYHTLVPLDVHAQKNDRIFGYTTVVYKAFNRQDGATYALRRVEKFKLTNESSIGLVEKWRKVVSANVVTVKEAFTSRAFGDDSILFVYDYHPLSCTLYDMHYERSTRKFAASSIIGEKLIWSYLTQLINGLRVIHALGLSCKSISSTKILVTEKNRLRINSCGILDVLAFDKQPSLEIQQRNDILAVGRIILGIALNDATAETNTPASFDLAARGYSAELTQLLKEMLEETSGVVTLDHIVLALAKHSMQNLDAALCYNDTLESELGRETENGRLVRLLCKFGFLNDRPEFDHDSAWGETGERHVLKLFRDYVFHQVDDHGRPVVDLGHVLSCLNKLDAGIDERLNLVSRDEQTSVIVTYKELKRCADQAWHGLLQQHKNTR